MRIIVPHILLSCHFEVFQATFIHQRWLKISIYSNALGKLCHRHVISLSSLSCLYTAKNKRIPDEQHVLIPAVSFSLRFLLRLFFFTLQSGSLAESPQGSPPQPGAFQMSWTSSGFPGSQRVESLGKEKRGVQNIWKASAWRKLP